MAALIEIVSCLVAQAVGLWIMVVSMPDAKGACFAYAFGVLLGALGSRLSAMWRERATELHG